MNDLSWFLAKFAVGRETAELALVAEQTRTHVLTCVISGQLGSGPGAFSLPGAALLHRPDTVEVG